MSAPGHLPTYVTGPSWSALLWEADAEMTGMVVGKRPDSEVRATASQVRFPPQADMEAQARQPLSQHMWRNILEAGLKMV